jgi:sRNA-binding protein
MHWAMIKSRTLATSPILHQALAATILLGALNLPALSQAQKDSTQTPDATQTTPQNSPPADPTKPEENAKPEPPKPTTPLTPDELRQAQILADTNKLYELAQELKAEVAKSNKDTLSLAVIKKAAEVEKLAKSLKDRMRIQESRPTPR